MKFQLLKLSSAEDTKFDRVKMEDLLKQKFFYDQSFSIYGGWFLFCHLKLINFYFYPSIICLVLLQRCHRPVRLRTDGLCCEGKHAECVAESFCAGRSDAGSWLLHVDAWTSSQVRLIRFSLSFLRKSIASRVAQLSKLSLFFVSFFQSFRSRWALLGLHGERFEKRRMFPSGPLDRRCARNDSH